MLKNYLLVALRQLYRNKFYALINVLGLGIAMAFCVVGYINYQYSQSFNTMYDQEERVYLVSSYIGEGGGLQRRPNTPTPLAPAMVDQLAGVDAFSRFAMTNGDVRFGEDVFREFLCYVDPNFFDMFNFTELDGDLSDWSKDPHAAVITDDISRKLFDDQSPVGRVVTIAVSREEQYDFRIAGVVEKPPNNSSFRSGILLHYERQAEIYGYNLTGWEDWTSASFVQLSQDLPPEQVESSMEPFLALSNQANTRLQLDGFSLTPLRETGELTREIGGALQVGMHPAAILTPSVTALLVLLLACFNFMNTSIAFAARRVREIGVRKVVGGMRSQLIGQFLGESLILCGLALLVAVVLSEIMVPAYGSLWPELDLSFNYADNLGLVAFLIGLLLFTGLAAGSYPALYVSGFSPTTIFRGRQKVGGTNNLIRVLLTLQLALSMTAIVTAAILTQNAEYMESFDYGYEAHNVYVIPVGSDTEYEIMRTELLARPEVSAVGGSRHLMMRSWSGVQAEIDSVESRVRYFAVGEDYIETMGVRLMEGRTFNADLVGDLQSAVIVNRTLAEQQGWTSIEGKSIDVLGANERIRYRVIGLVDDFYPDGMNSPIRPTILTLAEPERYQYLVARTSHSSDAPVVAFAEEVWSRNFPSFAFGGFWHEERIEEELLTNRSIKLIFLTVGIAVVIISAMGLLALVSLNIARRTREIGIRKVLGANAGNIGALIAREFVVLIAVGSLIAWGLGYYLTDILMASVWQYYCDFGVLPFIISFGVVMAVALTSVGFRVHAAAQSNPIGSLRCE